MFTDLTTPEQQRVAQNYMPQMGGRSPADIGTMMQMLISDPGLASQAMTMYNERSGNNSNSGGVNAGSRIDDMMNAMMAQDGTAQAAPMPVARPANVAVKSNNPNNVMPPSKPLELTGEDRVAKAGGPGSPRGTSAPSSDPTQVAEGSATAPMSSIVANTLASLGIGGAAGYGAYKAFGGPKQMPPQIPDGGANAPALNKGVGTDWDNYNDPERPRTAEQDMYDRINSGKGSYPGTAPKQLPPAAGGEVVPVNPMQQRFNQAFIDDIPGAEYRDVPAPKAVDERKKLTGPKETDDRDNVKKADGKPIQAEDATDEAGVNRTLNKGKATTAKEKLKPKVRVK
jgi:hypothetical protein